MSSKSKLPKILLVSASIGSGHTQAAEAIKASLENHEIAVTEVIDFMAGKKSYLNPLLKETYLKMIDIFPDIYDLMYRLSQTPLSGSKVQNLLSMTLKRTMLQLVHEHRPDAIICTHPFPCGAAAYLKRTHQISIPLIGVITDFAIHRFWCYNETDLYFVASSELKLELARQGIIPERIHATGIPVSSKFNHLPLSAEQADVRQTLGFENNHPVALIMGGGLGLGDLEQVVLAIDALCLPFNLVVVAGRNATLRRNLSAKAQSLVHPVKVLGYTNHVPELMAAANLLITKPGALTISEALSIHLPMVLCHAIPGQEEENAACLTSKGAALWAQNNHTLAGIVSDLFMNPDKLRSMQEKAAQLARPTAAQDITNIICQELLGTESADIAKNSFF